MECDFFKPTHPTKVWKIPYLFYLFFWRLPLEWPKTHFESMFFFLFFFLDFIPILKAPTQQHYFESLFVNLISVWVWQGSEIDSERLCSKLRSFISFIFTFIIHTASKTKKSKMHIKTIVTHTQYTGCLRKCPFVR